MSNPIYIGNQAGTFVCDRDPTNSEPQVDITFIQLSDGNDISNWLFGWWNRTNNTHYFCVDQTPDQLVWQKILMDGDV